MKHDETTQCFTLNGEFNKCKLKANMHTVISWHSKLLDTIINGLMSYFCKTNTIKYNVYLYSGKIGKSSVNRAFILVILSLIHANFIFTTRISSRYMLHMLSSININLIHYIQVNFILLINENLDDKILSTGFDYRH